jgi:hypothetical protein
MRTVSLNSLSKDLHREWLYRVRIAAIVKIRQISPCKSHSARRRNAKFGTLSPQKKLGLKSALTDFTAQ